MAVLQKIRNRGKVLVSVVGLALFAFIAEEAVRSFQSTANENRQKVGEIYGESLSVQDFNTMVDEFAEFEKAQRGVSQLDEQAMHNVREQAWQSYLNYTLFKHECDKVGLTVTDAEVQDVVKNGASQLLWQFARMVGMQQYDFAQVRNILSQIEMMQSDPQQAMYAEQMQVVKNLWIFVEKRVREELLIQKFVSLMQCSVGNNVLAKSSYEDRVNEYNVALAILPYETVADEDVQVDDNELREMYKRIKPALMNADENRQVEAISVKVVASQADRAALMSEMREYAATIGESTNLLKSVRESGSEMAYSSLPISRTRMPGDIAACVDTMSAGQVVGPFETTRDNTYNVVRLIGVVNVPDSIEYRQIDIAGADLVAARATADSIVAALKGGAVFDTLAAEKNQQGSKVWLTGAQYERQTLDNTTIKYLTALQETAAGQTTIVEVENGCIVLNVTDRRHFINKYDVAVVKRTINFSKETYTEEYNKLSQFLADNQTAEKIRENAAKKNYPIQSYDVNASSAGVGTISGTREALRWILNEDTDLDAVSPLYECGDNDNLLVCILKKVTPRGYLDIKDEMVAASLRQEVIKEKKAEKLIAAMTGKSLADVAKMEGACVDTLSHVSFANGMYVPSLRASEQYVGGALAGHKAGDVINPTKGESGVYAMQVIATQKSNETYNEANERNSSALANTRFALSQLRDHLYENAGVVDRRYIFY